MAASPVALPKAAALETASTQYTGLTGSQSHTMVEIRRGGKISPQHQPVQTGRLGSCGHGARLVALGVGLGGRMRRNKSSCIANAACM